MSKSSPSLPKRATKAAPILRSTYRAKPLRRPSRESELIWAGSNRACTAKKSSLMSVIAVIKSFRSFAELAYREVVEMVC